MNDEGSVLSILSSVASPAAAAVPQPCEDRTATFKRDIDTLLDSLDILVESASSEEFEKTVWPEMKARFVEETHLDRMKPLMQIMYVSGAASGSLTTTEVLMPAARDACVTERERCAKIAEGLCVAEPCGMAEMCDNSFRRAIAAKIRTGE